MVECILALSSLYSNPEVIILDEATSSLDGVAEMFVHKTLELLSNENKTLIVIAHRLSTIRLVDHIIVLNNGEVVQEGTFSELSVAEGYFRNMWMYQNIEIQESIIS